MSDSDDNSDSSSIINTFLTSNLQQYKSKQKIQYDFSIYHGVRCNKVFRAFKYNYKIKNGFLTCEEISLNKKFSDIVFSDGCGKSDFDENWYNKCNNDIEKSNINFRTSRAVYHCLQNTLATNENETISQIPQIVGLYRKFNASFYGITNNGKRYAMGKKSIEEVVDQECMKYTIEWRNDNFEIADPTTRQRKKGAQIQPSL